jgi:hypothetical protein
VSNTSTYLRVEGRLKSSLAGASMEDVLDAPDKVLDEENSPAREAAL